LSCYTGGNENFTTGTVGWWLGEVSDILDRKVGKGQIQFAERICIVTNGDDYEWAVDTGDYIYPTCVQAGPGVIKLDTLVLNRAPTEDETWPSKQVNILIAQGVFDRNNYMAKECPIVQSYCSDDLITTWWKDEVRKLVASQNIGQLDENWEHNICIGADQAVRYITNEGIINTCTGYHYEANPEGWSGDGDLQKTLTCAGRDSWECGFRTIETDQNPGSAIQQHRAIARALVQGDHTYPECSFNNGNYCESENSEQKQQPRYNNRTNCVDENHPNYHDSIVRVNGVDGVLEKIYKKHPGAAPGTYDLCYMADSDDPDILYYTIFVDGIGYPTCVQGPEETCQDNKYICVEEDKRTWPGTIAQRLLDAQVYGPNTRNNHMHVDCPTLQSICQAPGKTATLNSYQQGDLQPLEDGASSGQFDNNICLGEDGGIRVVTNEGVKPTCVGFHWDTSLSDDENKDTPCPAERNFMCGADQLADGRKTYGWYASQKTMIREALSQENFRHPQCPYVDCQDC